MRGGSREERGREGKQLILVKYLSRKYEDLRLILRIHTKNPEMGRKIEESLDGGGELCVQPAQLLGEF